MRHTRDWICCQLGAREHYAIPRALHRRGLLRSLITDFWWSTSGRFHPELAKLPVQAFNWSLAAFELFSRTRRIDGWQKVTARNEWFQRKVVRMLRRHAQQVQRHKSENGAVTLFTYSYASRDILRFAKQRGWRTVLGQIDPGPLEDEIVAAEVARVPEVAGRWEPAPARYWDNWRDECDLADQIVVNSEWSRDCISRAGVDERKIAVVPLAYDAPMRDHSHERQYPRKFSVDRPLRALFLGQVNLRKGLARLFEAIRMLAGAPVEFTIAGPVQIPVPSDVAQHPQVRWIGRVARSAAPELYRQADVFIFPTLSDGFGLTQLESLACGVPVIASTKCGRVVQSGLNGVVLESPSADAIVEALRFCVAHPQQLAAFSAKSRVADEFSLSAVGERLATLAQ